MGTSTWRVSPRSSNSLPLVLLAFLWLLVTLLVLPSATLWLVVSRTSCPAVATDIEFERAKEIKDLLNMDPEALAALQAASAPAASAPAADAAPAKVEEEEEESDDEMGFGLFD